MATKQYGLIIPKKSKQAAVKKPSVFEDDSEDEKDNTKSRSSEEKIDTWKSKVRKKTQLEMKKILDEDPTVYEYDSIYDNMQKEKEDKTTEVKTKDRKPKYIDSLLKAADNRKKEYERRVERGIQKEREQEGDVFKDKEEFVTSAYKKKMLEMQEQEEKERKEKEAEERMDVVKQKDLSGFYRHLLKQTAGEETNSGAGQKEPDVSVGKQDLPEDKGDCPDDKQSSELIRAKKAIEELQRSSSENRKENTNKKYSDSSDEERNKSRNNLKTHTEKFSQDRTSDDSSSEESHKRTKGKHKHRHESSHKHKKSKSRHHSNSEEESRHTKKHKHSKHNRSSHKDEKQKRKDKRRAHREEKHKRSNRHSSDSDSH